MNERLPREIDPEVWGEGHNDRVQTLKNNVILPLSNTENLSEKGKLFLDSLCGQLQDLCEPDLSPKELTLYVVRHDSEKYGQLDQGHDEEAKRVSQATINLLTQPGMNLSITDGINDLQKKIKSFAMGSYRLGWEGSCVQFATIIKGISIIYSEGDFGKEILIRKSVHNPSRILQENQPR